jgi:hypothetical protein
MIWFAISSMCAPVTMLLLKLGVDKAWCITWLVVCGVCLIVGIVNFFRKY